MKTFIASSEEYTGKIKEDLYIRDVLASRQNDVRIATLLEISKSAAAGDIVMLKSIWGYHLNPDLFLDIIDGFCKKGIRLINEYEFVRWNMNKHVYLADVAGYVSVVPTALLDVQAGDNKIKLNEKMKDMASSFDTDSLVVKPSISASGFLTRTYQAGSDNQDVISLIMENYRRQFIVQPYRNSIVGGELSVVVLKGKAMYGVMRRPGLFCEKGQPEHIRLADVPFQVLGMLDELNRFFMTKFKALPEICRVDLLKHAGIHEVLEIELIDPDLYIKYLDLADREEVLSAFCHMV